MVVDNDDNDDPDGFVLYEGIFRYERRDTRFVDNDYRYALLWASASEGTMLAAAVDDMVAKLRPLGPLGWNRNVLGQGNGAAMAAATEEAEHAREEA